MNIIKFFLMFILFQFLSGCATLSAEKCYRNYLDSQDFLSSFFIQKCYNFKSASNSLKEQCENNDYSSCHYLAKIYQHENHNEHANEYFKIACRAGEIVESCYEINDRFTLCTLGDIKRCFEIGEYGVACDFGNQKACFLKEKRICDKNRELSPSSFNVLKNACKEGVAESCLYLGNLILKEDLDRYESFLEKGIKIFQFACKKYKKGCNEMHASIKIKMLHDLKTDCNNNLMDSCHKLGMRLRADNSEENLKKGLVYFEKACFGGLLKSCESIKNHFFQTGNERKLGPIINQMCFLGSKKECKEIESLKTACEEGNPEKCNSIAEYMIEENLETSIKYRKEACFLGSKKSCDNICKSGDKDFCYMLANDYLKSNDLDKTGEYLKTACYLGDAFSCSNLLTLSNSNKFWDLGLDQNELLKQSCENGDEISCQIYDTSCLMQGMAYPNDKSAKECLEKIAKKDLELSKRNKNNSFAEHLKRCKTGNFLSCTYVGEAYASGIGVKKNKQSEKKYLALACDQNEPYACYALSWIDTKRKKQYLKQSCENGYKLACKAIDNLREKEIKETLIKERPKDAQNLVSKCNDYISFKSLINLMALEVKKSCKDSLLSQGVFFNSKVQNCFS
ncbi:MAG: tetratricopeptide repeat protein [bacterium]